MTHEIVEDAAGSAEALEEAALLRGARVRDEEADRVVQHPATDADLGQKQIRTKACDLQSYSKLIGARSRLYRFYRSLFLRKRLVLRKDIKTRAP